MEAGCQRRDHLGEPRRVGEKPQVVGQRQSTVYTKPEHGLHKYCVREQRGL